MNTVSQILQYAGLPAVLLVLASMTLLSRSARLKWLVISLNILISLRYYLWRGFFTLNPADYLALSISGVLLAAELYGFLQNILYYYQSSGSSNRVPPPIAGPPPMVDIFITIYNEPKDILLRTVIGCKAQDYPEDRLNIFVLDDGDRTEIKELAEKLNVRYVARKTNEDAKAGNLNNALGYSWGEFIAIFDCDHIPVRSFLRETVGFFSDPKVAIVQVPHHFYNPDTYQRNLRLEREIANEQDLFFHVIQPGRDRRNSAFFAGSCGLFRRRALVEIGGIITKTVTEDLHTSMVLHSRGYKSVYLNKDLSAGLAPESAASYIRQRERWTRGGVQVFVLDNPVIKRGLNIRQRIDYLASVLYFFHGLPRVVYLAAPLSYLLFGYAVLLTDVRTLLGYFVPHFIATVIAFNMTSRGFRNPFWSDVYETLMSFVLSLAVFRTILRPRGHKFVVTPKGERHEGYRLETSVIMPHIVLSGLLLLGAVWGLYGLSEGRADNGALAISLAWAAYNLLILLVATIAARERPQKRCHIRLERNIRCELILPDKKISCWTRDLSETGLSLKFDWPVAFKDPYIGLNLISAYGEVTVLKGQVVRNDKDKDGNIIVAVNFLGMDEVLERSVIRQMFSPENSWAGYHDRETSHKPFGFFKQLWAPFSGLLTRASVLKRLSPRFPIKNGCELVLGNRVVPGTIRDLSLTGLSMEVSAEAAVPSEVSVRVRVKDRPTITIKGEVAWQTRQSSKKVLGIRFSDPAESRDLWKAINPR